MYTLRDIQQETEQIEKYLEIVRAPARTALCSRKVLLKSRLAASEAGARALFCCCGAAALAEPARCARRTSCRRVCTRR